MSADFTKENERKIRKKAYGILKFVWDAHTNLCVYICALIY